MADPTEVHQEGPQKLVTVKVTTNAAVRDGKDVTDISENRLQEYDLLQKQVEAGLYDGDGPADVVKTSQEEVC